MNKSGQKCQLLPSGWGWHKAKLETKARFSNFSSLGSFTPHFAFPLSAPGDGGRCWHSSAQFKPRVRQVRL